MSLLLLKTYWRELGLAFLGAVIIGLILLDAHHARQRDELRAWQADVRGATSRAAGIVDERGKPALLRLDQVALQISYLGNGIERLTAALEGKNRESEDRARAFEASKRADTAARVKNAALAKSTDVRIEALKALARDLPTDPRCKAPAALLSQLEGL